MLYRMLNILNTAPRNKNYSSGSKMLHTDIHPKADENITKNRNNWCCFKQHVSGFAAFSAWDMGK